MQSLSIEIDTNKHLRHTNTTLSHYQAESCFQTSLQALPNFPVQNPYCFQSRPFETSHYSTQTCRDMMMPAHNSNRSCEKQDAAELRRYSKRNRTMFETSNSIDKAYTGSDVFDFSSKRIKPEDPMTLTDCTRSCATSDGNQSFQRNQHVSYDSQGSFFDDSIDLLSSPFETDIYSSLVQRFNETSSACSEQQQPTVSTTSGTNLTELKPIKDKTNRQKSCENNVFPTSRDRNGNSGTTVNDSTLLSSQSSFPSHSQCMMSDVPGLGQSCAFDYDQRYQPQTPLTTQSNYCNHSINITLRYK